MHEQQLTRGVQLFLLLLIVAGVMLRFAYLDRKIARFDEVFTRLHTTGHDEHEEANVALYTGAPVPANTLLRFLHHDAGKTVLDTAKVLLYKETTKTPLYHTLAWAWTRLLGDDLALYRALSALFGLLSLPALYWLCRELGYSRRSTALALGLLAVSPMMVRHSQDARPYSIWLLVTLLSSAALLRALRVDGSKHSRVAWGMYALTIPLSLYTQLLSLIVLAAHALYVLLCERDVRAAFTLRSRTVRHYMIASLVGGALFLPWFILFLRNIRMAMATMGYISESLGVAFTVREWALNGARLLFATPPAMHDWLALSSLVVVVFMGVATYTLIRKSPRSMWLLLLLILVITIATYVLPDVLFGGQRSVRDRYFIPAYAASILILAFWLDDIMRRRAGQVLTVALLLGALGSSLYSVQSNSWWEAVEIDVEVAARVNEGENALVISDTVFGVLGMLADDLDEDVHLLLTKDPDTLTLPPTWQGPIWVYQPSPNLLAHIQAWPNVALNLVYQADRWDKTPYYLYRLQR